MTPNMDLLLYLARKGALYHEVIVSAALVAKDLGTTRQTAARKLEELSDEDIIEKISSSTGTVIKIRKKGVEELKDHYLTLKEIFTEIRLVKGSLVSGLGEGGYYVSLPEYQKQFKEKLGFVPYKGTLNLKIKENIENLLAQKEKIAIHGFKKEGRTFGGISAYSIKINNVKAAIIMPERTSHAKDLIEIIAPILERLSFCFLR